MESKAKEALRASTLLDRLYEGANSTSPGNALFGEAAEEIMRLTDALRAGPAPRGIAAMLAQQGFTEPGTYNRGADRVTLWRDADNVMHGLVSYGAAKRG